MALQTERQIEDSISNSAHTLIAFRKDWTVDAVASALALARLLETRGKKVDIIADNFTPSKQVAWLPKIDCVIPEFNQLRKFVISLDVSKAPIDELSYDLTGNQLNIHITPKTGQFKTTDVLTRAADFKYDLIFTVGTPDLGSLGRLFSEHSELFYHCPIINIDHDAQNENYGQVNAVDITATSTAEIIHHLLTKNEQLTEDIATMLLTGIIASTRSFRVPQVTPRTLDIAAELLAAGARREEIVQNLYKTRSLATLKLWGRALARLKYDPEIKMVWSLLVRQDFIHTGSDEECLPEVMDELMISAPEAEIATLIYEKSGINGESTNVCALMTSERHANTLGLVPDLRPEGHRRLARICFTTKDIQQSEQAVLNSIRKSLGKVRQPEFVSRNNESNETLKDRIMTVKSIMTPPKIPTEKIEMTKLITVQKSESEKTAHFPNETISDAAKDGLSLSALTNENVIQIKSAGQTNVRQPSVIPKTT
jgi:phosphoesterase RecJ-like protein